MRKNQMRRGHNFIRLGLHGRLMKDGEGEGGATGGDNGQGNSDAGGSGDGESNNDGQAFDPKAFWGGSDSDGNPDPSGESAQGAGDDESGSSGESLQEVLTGRLEKMTFGEPVFTAEVAEQFAAGDFKGVEERIQAQMRASVRNSMSMMVQILRPFSEQLMTQAREEMQQTFTGRDNNEALETTFPAAKNPAVRPMIQGIYTQALKNAKGNRAEAVKQTKEMLKFAAGVTADDLDISVAPRGSEDSGRPAPNIDWLDELTGRG